MPALYLSHGAPPLVDDATWVSELARWAAELPTPDSILMVSAHWESAPLTIGSTATKTPLTYDFWGFAEHYYNVTYDAPGAADLAARVEALMPDGEVVAHDHDRRLDHGAYVPLTVMYPDAAIPVLQISLPTLDPQRLLDLGALLDFRARAPGMPFAHPTIEHFAPLFVALGASADPGQAPRQVIDGFWMGLSKRSIQLA
jgi:4,5-DOPA dioxygenase extradiol